MEKRYEEHAYVIDFLPHGKAGFRQPDELVTEQERSFNVWAKKCYTF
jgi:hypothetical protein